jgi:predicted anti-sigma-YlaC factor YlaD
MECDLAREAISARIDGEDPGLQDDVLDVHLAGCAACRSWQQRAHGVTRRTRLGGPFLDHDLRPQVLAAFPPAARGLQRLSAQRAGLAALAAAQLAITVPLLIFGHDHDAGAHAAHELGSFDLGLAIAFAVGAIRPALSAGLAWPCGIAAAGLAGTAIADLIGGQAIGADEAQHLIAVFGATLLFWQARTYRSGTTGAAVAGDRAVAAGRDAVAERAVLFRVEDPPDPPGGGAVGRGSTQTPRRGREGGGKEAVA